MNATFCASVIVCVAGAAGCKVDPLYCDESHRCTDPARTFCDLNGEYPASEGVPRTCIADPQADGGPDTETSFSIAVASERLYVRQGETAEVDVTVTREGDFDDAVTVAIDGLPAGVTADPVTFDGDQTTGRVTISAEGDAAQGAVDLDVSGTAGDVVRTGRLRLLVAGPPGTLDQSFATGGRFTLRFGDGDTLGGGLVIQGDGKVIVGGEVFSQAPSLQGFAIRLTADGALDDSFGLHGVASPEVGHAPLHDTVTITREGRILVGGTLVEEGTPRLALFGYTPEGNIDTTFGSEGKARLVPTMPGGTTGIVRLFQLQDGAILSVGVTADATGFTGLHVARHSADGVPDESYGISTPSKLAATAILDREGRLIVGGQISAPDLPTVPSFIARYLPDGSSDSTFGTGGVVEVSDLSADFQGVLGLVELEGGRLLAIGFARTTDTVLTLARYNASGIPDLTFGDGGTLVTSIEFEARARGALLDQDDRVVVAGRVSTNVPTVARIRPDGSLDATFGDSGLASVNFGIAGAGASQANGLGIDADGRILISCAVGDTGSTTLAVARLWP